MQNTFFKFIALNDLTCTNSSNSLREIHKQIIKTYFLVEYIKYIQLVSVTCSQ